MVPPAAVIKPRRFAAYDDRSRRPGLGSDRPLSFMPSVNLSLRRTDVMHFDRSTGGVAVRFAALVATRLAAPFVAGFAEPG